MLRYGVVCAVWCGRCAQEKRQELRDTFRIVVDGHNIPPPITTFRDMKFPEPIWWVGGWGDMGGMGV